MFADGYGPRRRVVRRRSRRRRVVRIAAPLAVPIALGITLGIILAVSSGPTVTHVNQQTGSVATTSVNPSPMPSQP